jgi:hypothetical protein
VQQHPRVRFQNHRIARSDEEVVDGLRLNAARKLSLPPNAPERVGPTVDEDSPHAVAAQASAL